MHHKSDIFNDEKTLERLKLFSLLVKTADFFTKK